MKRPTAFVYFPSANSTSSVCSRSNRFPFLLAALPTLDFFLNNLTPLYSLIFCLATRIKDSIFRFSSASELFSIWKKRPTRIEVIEKKGGKGNRQVSEPLKDIVGWDPSRGDRAKQYRDGWRQSLTRLKRTKKNCDGEKATWSFFLCHGCVSEFTVKVPFLFYFIFYRMRIFFHGTNLGRILHQKH